MTENRGQPTRTGAETNAVKVKPKPHGRARGGRRALLQMAAVAAAAGGAGLLRGAGVEAVDGTYTNLTVTERLTVDGLADLARLNVDFDATAAAFVANGVGSLRGLLVEQGSADASAALIRTRKARGTSVIWAVRSNDALLSFRAQAGDGETYHDAAALHVSAAENWAPGKHGARVTFFSTPVGTAAPVERMRFDALGNVTINTTNSANVILNQAPASDATSGFPYIPAMAGEPTGTPASIPGHAPVVLDTLNKKLWVFMDGEWVGSPLA